MRRSFGQTKLPLITWILLDRHIHLGVISSGRCEEIKKLVWGNFGSKKSRARMPSKRSLGRRHTFCISLDFGQINFFTSSCPETLAPKLLSSIGNEFLWGPRFCSVGRGCIAFSRL
jgi:hypothetical protein